MNNMPTNNNLSYPPNGWPPNHNPINNQLTPSYNQLVTSSYPPLGYPPVQTNLVPSPNYTHTINTSNQNLYTAPNPVSTIIPYTSQTPLSNPIQYTNQALLPVSNNQFVTTSTIVPYTNTVPM